MPTRPALCLLLGPAMCLSLHSGAAVGRSSQPRLLLRHSQLRMAPSAKEIEEEAEVWKFRGDMARGAYTLLVSLKEDEREEAAARAEREAAGGSAEAEATKSAFVASVTAVLAGAVLLRLGGRAALVSLLGLDLVAELGLGDQIDQARAAPVPSARDPARA